MLGHLQHSLLFGTIWQATVLEPFDLTRQLIPAAIGQRVGNGMATKRRFQLLIVMAAPQQGGFMPKSPSTTMALLLSASVLVANVMLM